MAVLLPDIIDMIINVICFMNMPKILRGHAAHETTVFGVFRLRYFRPSHFFRMFQQPVQQLSPIILPKF